ncbi:hypothetical protein EYF80_045064 [Liparis tanakae]|uniref:Uncharacterized protein n=1 Tax=Liparis tanakae TaxID=230148 RepID=A0A4Z2FVW5_9TELE|nr:hypothetical protein EYF80_045064 [Liparis tanakae]
MKSGQLVKEAVACPLVLAVSSFAERTSHVQQLLLAVAQVINVDERHLIEGQHRPLFDPVQDHGVQLGVVVQQGAVDLQAQQVGGEVDVLDARGKLACLGRHHLGPEYSRLSEVPRAGVDVGHPGQVPHGVGHAILTAIVRAEVQNLLGVLLHLHGDR